MTNEEYSQLLARFGCRVSECSRDKTNLRTLVESDVKVVNFDDVKEYYRDQNNLDSTPSSADSLLLTPKGQEVFVEFKAGKTVDLKKLITKAYDSVIIYSNLMNQSPKYLSKNGIFILVYNKELEIENDPNVFPRTNVYQVPMKLAKKELNIFVPSKIKNMLKKFLFSKIIELSDEDFKRQYLDSNPNT